MSSPTTSLHLIAQVTAGGDDRLAWDRFVSTYGPVIVRWCRGYGLQPSDAHDIAQDVLLQFWKQCQRFEYDPERRFRSWLRKLVHAALHGASQRRKRWSPAAGGGESDGLLDNLPAREDLLARIEEAYDQELLAHAMERVRSRVEPRTWEAFQVMAFEGLGGDAAAARLGMKVQTAYAARHKVQRLIREELARIEPPE
ncbi:MAG: sigma-70 family RNA polymerase sigma factor [Isosphaeraceae bacterium]